MPPARPQLTLKIVFLAVFDVIGMVLFATGAMWLARSESLFIPDFPSSMAEALAASIVGLVLMVWAAAQILRELLTGQVNKPQEGR